jgi:hypothetical protein
VEDVRKFQLSKLKSKKEPVKKVVVDKTKNVPKSADLMIG